MGINSKKNSKKRYDNFELDGIYKTIHSLISDLVISNAKTNIIQKHYVNNPKLADLFIVLTNNILIANSLQCKSIRSDDKNMDVTINGTIFGMSMINNTIWIYLGDPDDPRNSEILSFEKIVKLISLETYIKYIIDIYSIHMPYNKVIFKIMEILLKDILITVSSIKIKHITTDAITLELQEWASSDPFEINIPIKNNDLILDKYSSKEYNSRYNQYTAQFMKLYTDLFIANDIPDIIYNNE